MSKTNMKNEHTWIKNIPEARIAIGYNKAWFLANRGSIFFLLPRRHRTCRLHSHFFLTLRFSRTKDDLHSNTTSTIQADSCKWRTFRFKLFIFLFLSPFYYFSLILFFTRIRINFFDLFCLFLMHKMI